MKSPSCLFVMQTWIAVVVMLLLSSCVIPVAGVFHPSGFQQLTKSEKDALIGKSIEYVREVISVEPDSSLTEKDCKYLLYHGVEDAAVLIIATMGGGGGIPIERTDCYRLTFCGAQGLKKIERKFVKPYSADGTLDCRTLFWSHDELQALKSSQEQLARLGNREAILELAREYEETRYLKVSALRDRDLELATILASEFGDYAALAELAKTSEQAAEELKWLNIERDSASPLVKGKRIREIYYEAMAGDREAQLQLYYSRVGPNPMIWLCRAADQGSPEARYRLGDVYWFGKTEINWLGKTEIRSDYVQAFKWYRLANLVSAPHADSAVNRVKKSLTQDEFIFAEKLVSEWKPGLCEVEVGQAFTGAEFRVR